MNKPYPYSRKCTLHWTSTQKRSALHWHWIGRDEYALQVPGARVSQKLLLQYSDKDKVVQTSAIKTLYYVVPIANLTEAKISLLDEQYPGWRVDFNLVQDCPADISEDSHIIVDKFVDKGILGPGVRIGRS